MKVRSQVATATILTAVLAVVVVAGLGAALSGRFLVRTAQNELRRQAEAASEVVAAIDRPDPRMPLAGRRPRTVERVMQALLRRSGVTGLLVDLDGPSGAARDLVDGDRLARVRAGETVQGTGSVQDVPVVYVLVPGPPPVLVYRRATVLGDAARAVGRRLLLAGGIAALAVGVVGWWVGGRLTRPVLATAAAATGIAEGDLARRAPLEVVNRTDEFGTLGRDFNAMAEALAAARDQQRQFFLSVGHELRTPLTNIQGYAEGLLDGRFAQEAARRDAALVIHDEALRLARLVGDVMTLAQLEENTFAVEPWQGDAGEVVSAAGRAVGELAQRAGIRMEVDVLPTPVVTDPDRLRQVVDNLVANALRVTPTGGVVRLRCAPTADGGVRIEVTDSGPGLDPEDVPRAFERYHLWSRYRGQREVGTGLGLSIVDELTRRLGGSVVVDPGGEGRGATFTVTLPPAPPSPPTQMPVPPALETSDVTLS